MNISVTVEPGLADLLRRGGQRADDLMLDGLDELGRAFVDQARRTAGAGAYARSFDSRRDGSNRVVAGSRSPLASIIEKGRKPGRRPTINRRMTPQAATQIAAKGTRGRYVVKRAAETVRSDGTVDRVARDVVRRIAQGG
jgi:hypothetical protein